MRRFLTLAVFFAALSFATACNVGPQPLPPGATDNGAEDPGAVSSVDGGPAGSGFSDDAGAATPTADGDGGRSADASTLDAGDASDGSSDAGAATTDAGPDADPVGGDH